MLPLLTGHLKKAISHKNVNKWIKVNIVESDICNN